MSKIKVDGVNLNEVEKIKNILNAEGHEVDFVFKKRAIVTGVTGQDGAYLSKLLLDRGYEVFGTVRRVSTPNFWSLEELKIKDHPNFHIIDHDVTDAGSTFRIVKEVMPDEIYNLAAQSFVAASFKTPYSTSEINAIGPLNFLESIRVLNPKIRFYQASTSEMFGKVQDLIQNENTKFYPRSPYGVAKLFAHWATVNYRESYGIFTCSGILFNHESPLRSIEFVTRKITDGVAKIKLGKLDHLELGNLNAKREWGYAGDYVEGMYLMMQQEKPEDFVLATGVTHTVRDFVSLAFKSVGIQVLSKGENENEELYDALTGKVLVKVNKDFYRPAEVDTLTGDATKARNILGWKPKVEFAELCGMMVKVDLERNKNVEETRNSPFA